MPRLSKPAAVLLVACLLPLLTLQAQQPAATTTPTPTPQPNQPSAKDVIKAVEKKDEAKNASANDPVERIKEEGQKHSQVMATLSYLTDVIGPRLTGSPNLKRANEWTRDKLTSWGLQNAHLESWGSFGRGWSLKRFSAQLVEPQCTPLIAYPKAWSPGVDGTVVAEVVHMTARNEADLAKYKGKLKGAIVLNGPVRNLAARFEPLARRLTDTQLLTLANASEPAKGKAGRRPPQGRGALEFNRKRLQFLIDEGAAVVVDCSAQGDGGTLFVASASVPAASSTPGSRAISAWSKDAPKTVPQLVMAAEHFNRMVRMLEQGEKLKAAIELAVEFHDEDPLAYNTIAEIPGTDLKHELVMLGGHMDSWHSGTGATDNAAGIAVGMEAVRILKALDLKPRRTIRIGLWTGEEQGLLGSRGYVAKHFGRPPSARGGARSPNGDNESASTKAEHDAFSGYFNLDNGTGKVRGVYLQGNEEVRPIFRSWLRPFRDMGASTLSIANTGGTDHLSFDAVGLPGFQFIQDEIEYDTRTHHSNQDLFDRIQADDMKQAAVIMAAFVYNTAMRDEKLPRKPRPKPPVSATVQTSLGTASDQIRQYAFDGDRSTYFASDGNAGSDDHFTLVFDEPVAVKSIAVDTGKTGGDSKLKSGTLEVSADGKVFEPLAKFADGSARSELKDRSVRAVRIKPEGEAKEPLVIRELTVDSEPPVATFAYPVEIAVDVSDAPEMKEWAENAARTCERTYPLINEELRTEGYKPPATIKMTLKKDYRGVAAASGNRITGSVAFFKAHPDDVGAMVHETTHVVQHYGGRRGNPSWLVEGVADYVRFFKYEPGKIGRIDPNRARYDRSYRVTAAFLAYLADKYDPDIVLRLNTIMREGRYKEDVFRDLTGKPVQDLNEEWLATIRR